MGKANRRFVPSTASLPCTSRRRPPRLGMWFDDKSAGFQLENYGCSNSWKLMTLEVILQILCETGMSPGRRFLERYLRGWWSCLSKSAPIVLLRGTQNWLGSQQSHGLSISPYRVSLIFLSENIYPEETCSFGYTQFSNTLKIHITCIIYIYI